MADLDDLSGRVLGDFVLRERLDEGGYGAVYRCEQPALGRNVVVKVLHQRLRDRDAAAQRFQREAQAAVRLDHPYAAHVYGFGIEPDGLLWIAMERVAGVTLEAWLRERGPMPLEVLAPLLERIAEVVQAAHERGIVHRDLKPANIMLIERAGRLLPKLLDFGIAKILGEVSERAAPVDIGDSAEPLTPADMTLGSPPYMSPEQWSEPTSVGPAADLYALGVVVYEALAGRRPFRGETRVALAAAHLAGEVPPVGVPGIDAVLTRALAKAPADRYATALEFSGAIRAELEARLLAGVRAAARQWRDRGRPAGLLWRDSALGEVERWMTRTGHGALEGHELDFVLAALEARQVAARRATWMRRSAAALVLALASLAIGTVRYRADTEVRVARAVADAAALDAEVEQGRAALLHGEIAEAQPHLLEADRRGDHSSSTAFMLARAMQPLRAELARFHAASGRVWAAAWAPDSAHVVVADDRGARIWDVTTHRLVATLPVGDTVYDVKYSVDGSQIVTAGGDGAVRIWTAAGAPVRELRGARARLRYYALALAPGVVAAVDTAGVVADVWDARSGALLAELSGDGSEWPSLAFSADGRWLAASGGDSVAVYDTTTWARAVVLPGRQIRAVAWDPIAPRLVTGSSTGDASIWDVPSGGRLHHLRDIGEPIDAVAWSRDGRLVAAGARDGAVQVFDVADGRVVSQGNQLHAKVIGLDFDVDSRFVAAAGAGGDVSVVEAATGLPVALFDGPRGLVRSARWDPGSHRVLDANTAGEARIWSAASPYRRWTSTPIAERCGVATSLVPDRRVVAVPCNGHETLIWDTAQDQLLGVLPSALAGEVGAEPPLPAVNAAGDRTAVARGDHVDLYELPGPRLVRSVRHAAAVMSVAIDDASGAVASGDAGGVVMVTQPGAEPAALVRDGAPVDALAWLPGGRLAIADRAGLLRVVDGTGAELAVAHAPPRPALLRPSNDGGRIVVVPSATSPDAPVLWRVGDLEARRLAGHTGRVMAARWIAGDRILTAGVDGMARMWDGEGRLLQAYRGGALYLVDVALSPDGALVVGGDWGGLLRYWDAATGRPLWITPAHRGAVVGLHFEGEDLVTRGVGGEVSRWRIPEK